MKGISDMSNKISVKLILELKAQGLSQNEIARTRHMSKSSVSDVIRIAGEKGLSFEDVEGMNNDALYQMFFPDRITSEQIGSPCICVGYQLTPLLMLPPF